MAGKELHLQAVLITRMELVSAYRGPRRDDIQERLEMLESLTSCNVMRYQALMRARHLPTGELIQH